MRTTRRRLTITLTALAVAWAGLTSPPALAGPGESSFLAKMNAERSGRGLAPVEMYWDLVDDARAHSRRMADTNDLHHNPNLAAVTSGWITLGENVGVGPTVDSLHAAFMDSAGHRANILGDFNYVGVGVVAESDTKLWVTVVFMKGPEGLNAPPEEAPPPEPEPPPQAEPPPPAEPPSGAVTSAAPADARPRRRSCGHDAAAGAGSRAGTPSRTAGPRAVCRLNRPPTPSPGPNPPAAAPAYPSIRPSVRVSHGTPGATSTTSLRVPVTTATSPGCSISSSRSPLAARTETSGFTSACGASPQKPPPIPKVASDTSPSL